MEKSQKKTTATTMSTSSKKKDEFDSIRTITELRNIIIRANKRLKTVEWDLYFYSIENAKLQMVVEVYRLVKNIQLRDTNNLTYWWPTIVVGDIPRHRLLKWFRIWCRANRRDTLAKAAATHSDYKRALSKPKVKKSLAVSDMEQQTLGF